MVNGGSGSGGAAAWGDEASADGVVAPIAHACCAAELASAAQRHVLHGWLEARHMGVCAHVKRRLTTAEDAPAARACQAGGPTGSIVLRSVAPRSAICWVRRGWWGRAWRGRRRGQVHALMRQRPLRCRTIWNNCQCVLAMLHAGLGRALEWRGQRGGPELFDACAARPQTPNTRGTDCTIPGAVLATPPHEP